MVRVLDFREVEQRVSLKESRIKQLVKAGKFPLPSKPGGRKLCWLESEIEAWVASRFAERVEVHPEGVKQPLHLLGRGGRKLQRG